MLKKFEAQLYAGQSEEGMEMIQVAFSIAIAVMLAIVVLSIINNVVIPGLEVVAEDAEALFNEILNDHTVNDEVTIQSGTDVFPTTN